MHIKLLSVAKVQIKPKTTSKKTKILNKNNFISLQRVVFFGLFSEINRVLFRQLAGYYSGSWPIVIPAVGWLLLCPLQHSPHPNEKDWTRVRPVFLFLSLSLF